MQSSGALKVRVRRSVFKGEFLEIDKARLPVLAFGACCVLAVAVALLTGEWVAALALALAGLALAFAMRAGQQDDPETDGAGQALSQENEIASLRAAVAGRDAEIDTLRDSLDGLAEIIESLIDQGTGPAQDGGPRMAELSAGLRALEARTESLAQSDPAILERLAALETGMSRALAEAEGRAQAAAIRAQSGSTDPVTVSHAAMAIPAAPRGRLDTLRDMAQRGGQAADDQQPAEIRTASAAIYGTDLRAPRAYIVAAAQDASPLEAAAAAMRRACAMAKKDTADCLFLPQIDPALSGNEDFTALALDALEMAGQAAQRVLPLTAQSALQQDNPKLLLALHERGMGFVLQDIRDWSLDLPGLAQRGLRYLMVDGPAMVRTAAQQKGDPARLKAVLSRSNIGLIVTGIDDEAALEAVAALQPDLLYGSALEQQREPEHA